MTENEKKQIELTCDIVGDLLPLYHDDMVSEGTKEAVGRHLATCEKCVKEYEFLKEELPGIDSEEEKKASRISVFLKRVKKRGILKGIVVTVIAVVFLIGAGYVLTQVPLIEAPAESYSVEHVFEEDGNFFLVCKMKQYKNPTAVYTDYDKKQVHLTYKIPIIHFFADEKTIIDIMSLDRKKDLEANDCKPESILYNGKKIYQAGDGKNQEEVPEYVKVYFEYSNSGKGMAISLDENRIGLSLLTGEGDGENAASSGYKEWDWEGNLIYEASESEEE